MQLDFLETIEGTSGEKLTSAALKYLIVNSALFRDLLIAKISRHVPPGYAPSFRNGLYCRTEYPTEDEEFGKGSIDIILCDGEPKKVSFVAAFEVKMWAAFTPHQPAKYLNTLKDMVDKGRSCLLIIVLVPDGRQKSVRDHLDQQEQLPAVKPAHFWDWKWSEICEDLKTIAQEESPSVALVAKWLLRFLEVNLGAMNLQGTPDAYVGCNVEIGNDYHFHFLYKLKACLPAPGRVTKRDGNDPYVGFACECVVQESPEQFVAKVWIGFIAKPDGAVAFGIDTGLRCPDQLNTLCKWGREFKEIPFDAELKTALQWQEKLTPELEVIQMRRKQSMPIDAVKAVMV